MRELILIFTYLVCAFITVFFLKLTGYRFSWRLFWLSWFISLSGAFFGGVFGIMLLNRLGFEFGLITSAIPAFLGACLFIGVFLFLKSIPEKW